MTQVPITNESISDVVWAALNLSDRCKGGTDININVLPSGAVVLDIYLQGYNKSPEYRQYRIVSDEDAKEALAMIQETKERTPQTAEERPVKEEFLQSVTNWLLAIIVRIDHRREYRRKEKAEWYMLLNAERQ